MTVWSRVIGLAARPLRGRGLRARTRALGASARRGSRRLLLARRPPLAFLGHHRSASTWISKRVLQPVCERVGLRWTYSYTPAQLDEALARCEGAPVLHCHVNADRDSAGRIGPSRGFHVIRDPRDVIVSGYYAHLHSHSIGPWRELEGHRRLLRSLSREAGLLAEIEFSSRLPTEGHLLEPFRALAEWDFAQPNLLELRFEALVSDPLGTVLEALGFLGLLGSGPWRISRRRVARLVEGVAFPRLSGGRARGQADPASHYRAGVVGEWRTHFGPEHKRAFEERHPGLLQRLGYEADGGW